jgi:hypothetical protein
VLPYRDFYYPLNVFMHILTLEEGSVSALHYGLFERPDEPIAVAQERSTELLLSRLPAPPAALLEVGIGLGRTLERLTRMGYDVEGITPDEKQIAMAPAGLRIHHSAFESFETDRTYDAIVFQESSQYIDAARLFSRARELAPRVLVVDEFALREAPSLHPLDRFLTEAELHGFRVAEEIDLSKQAAPTVAYFTARLPRYRERLIADLGLTDAQVDELIDNGERYFASYGDGTYGYRFLDFVLLRS